MTEPIPDNNELDAAEEELRKIGSNLWFGGLSEQWQDFLVSNTVEFFDTYEVSMQQAASELIRIYKVLANADPCILQKNPCDADIKIS
jgi:hypothetical protein